MASSGISQLATFDEQGNHAEVDRNHGMFKHIPIFLRIVGKYLLHDAYALMLHLFPHWIDVEWSTATQWPSGPVAITAPNIGTSGIYATGR